ncbi:MAG TPA: SPW repeat protein [Rubricoccaceae bacterium]|nr:SPW repeat protein [Rubricoccaceae bacterium]
MWAQVVNALLGVWLMAAPAVLGYGAPAAVNDRIVGPVAASFAVIAWWQATRPARWVNLPLGLWLIAAPFVLGYGATAPLVNSLAVGAALAALSLVRGTVDKRFGGGWRAVWGRRPMHEAEARRLS